MSGTVPQHGREGGGRARRWLVICHASAFAGLIIWAILYRYSGVHEQIENMRLAREHLPQVRPILASEPRFAKVTADEYTGEGGSLGFFGYVRTDSDLSDLRRAVYATSPPVHVVWGVKVVGSEMDDELSAE